MIAHQVVPFYLGHIEFFCFFPNTWVKTGLCIFFDDKKIILCLFYSQQPGNDAFMSCEPHFLGHIKVNYYSSFSALI